jgi:hypothetical protein
MIRLCLRVKLTQAAAVLLVLVVMSAGHAQSNGSNGGQGGSRVLPFGARPDSPVSGDSYDSVMMGRRMRAMNIERQKEMVSDTNKLLRLARELNAEVAFQRSDALTPDQVRKVAEIEKLAKNVRERMALAVGQPQPGINTPAVLFPYHN